MVTEIMEKLQNNIAVDRNTAFSALPENVRAYSARVGYNAWLLYSKALEKKLYHTDNGLKAKNAPYVYEAVRYFDVGYTVVDMSADKGGEHTRFGATILSGDIKALDNKNALSAAEKAIREMARLAAAHHHELWNGEGVPEKLRGERIPVIARICAICNAFDVYTSARNISGAIAKKAALEKMQDKAGTSFDPLLLNALVECADRLAVEGKEFPSLEEFNITQKNQGKVVTNVTATYKKLNEYVRPIEMWYYPVSDIDAQNASYYEARVRINDRYYGVVNTDLLLSVAERTGKICDITDIMLEQVFEMIVIGRARFFDSKRVSVNVSEKYFKRRNLVTKIKKFSQMYGVSPKSFIIEVKETVIAAADDAVVATLKQLRELGVKIAVCGFGMEYSSLSRLDKMEFDILKIDKSFVKQIDDSQRVKGLVKGIIEMAKSIGVEIVAEEVETEKQRALLRTLECDKITGPLIGQPVTLREIVE